MKEYQDRSKNRSEPRVIGLAYKEKRAILDEYKISRGCYFCDERTAVCLDFHHLVEQEKSFTISKHFHRPVEELLQEAEKCEIVCANCHRKLHAGLISF